MYSIYKGQVHIGTLNETSFPGFYPTHPYIVIERQRPWLGLVTWLQNKLILRAGVLCLSIFLLQWSKIEQDRFTNPITKTETMGNFCLNRNATR